MSTCVLPKAVRREILFLSGIEGINPSDFESCSQPTLLNKQGVGVQAVCWYRTLGRFALQAGCRRRSCGVSSALVAGE